MTGFDILGFGRKKKKEKKEIRVEKKTAGNCFICNKEMKLREFRYKFIISTILNRKMLGWGLLCDGCKETLLKNDTKGIKKVIQKV